MTLVELAFDCRNHHGEGVVWNSFDQQVWWTDIEGREMWSYDPRTNSAKHFDMQERVCCFAPRKNGGFVLAMADGFALWSPLTNEYSSIDSFEPHLSQTRTNDGRTDRQGRFVVGGMDERDGNPISSVCRLEQDLSLTHLFNGVSCANSICFSPDGKTMYFADSPSKTIEAFDYPSDRSLPCNRRIVADMTQSSGVPDGSCVDREGYIWNAVWLGSRLERRSPDGRLDRTVPMPISKPTCCAFGGEALDTLYVTSSRLYSSPDELKTEPLSGSLFAFKPGVIGLVDIPFSE